MIIVNDRVRQNSLLSAVTTNMHHILAFCVYSFEQQNVKANVDQVTLNLLLPMHPMYSILNSTPFDKLVKVAGR